MNEKYIKLFKKYKRIIFGFSFNRTMKNKIPTNIVFIQFAHNFNQSINNLPSLIEELDIGGKCFNHMIQILPNELKKIKLNSMYYSTNMDKLKIIIKPDIVVELN